MTEKRYTTMWKPETTFSRFWIVRENWERKLNANDVVDLLNEQHEQIERLKGNFRALDEVKCELAEENEQLKQFKKKVFTLIEEELEEHPYLTLTEKWNPNCKNYHSCRGNHEKNVFYASRHTLLEKLREKLSYD